MRDKCLQFPNRLEELRTEKNLSRQQLADSLGISRASLEYYEKGLRTPDISVLYKLSEQFNVSADYLIGRTEISGENVQVNAISEYTGLSTAAIERLHKRKECAAKIKTGNEIVRNQLKEDIIKRYCSEQLTPEKIKELSLRNARFESMSKNTEEIYLCILDELIKNDVLEFSKIIYDISEYLEADNNSAVLEEKANELGVEGCDFSALSAYHMFNLSYHIRSTIEKLQTIYENRGSDNGND